MPALVAWATNLLCLATWVSQIEYINLWTVEEQGICK